MRAFNLSPLHAKKSYWSRLGLATATGSKNVQKLRRLSQKRQTCFLAWSLLRESKIRLFSYFLRSLVLKPIINCFPFYQQRIWHFCFSVITSSLRFTNSESKWAKTLGCFGCRLRAWCKWETTGRFSTFVVRSVKGSSWSTNKAYKEVIFLSACSSRWVMEKKILGFLENRTLCTIN